MTSFFYQGGNGNENGRYVQVKNIAQEFRFDLAPYAYKTADSYKYNDKTYQNKPPGFTLTSVIPWKVSTFITEKLKLDINITAYLTRILTSGLSLVVLILIFYNFLLLINVSKNLSLLYSLSLLATSLFTFSTLFMSHVFVALLLFSSTVLIYKKNKNSLLFAYFLLSLATITEYSALFPAILIFIYSLKIYNFKIKNKQFILAIVIGLIPILIHCLYTYILFDHPFISTYSAYKDSTKFAAHSKGILGVSFPSLKILKEITFGSSRGLFYFNPFLVFFILSSILLFIKEFKYKSEVFLSLSIIFTYFLFNASYGTSHMSFWAGGFSFTPRHIIPSIPFMVLLIALISNHFKKLSIVIIPFISYSFIITLIATFTEPRISWFNRNPLFDSLIYNFLLTNFSLNLNSPFEINYFTNNSVAFNLAELIKINDILILGIYTFISGLILFFNKENKYNKLYFSSFCILSIFFITTPYFYQRNHQIFDNTKKPSILLKDISNKNTKKINEFLIPKHNLKTGNEFLIKANVYFPKESNYYFRTPNGFEIIDFRIDDLKAKSSKSINNYSIKVKNGSFDIFLRFKALDTHNDFYLLWKNSNQAVHLIPNRLINVYNN